RDGLDAWAANGRVTWPRRLLLGRGCAVGFGDRAREAPLDHLEWQEVLALLAQDPTQALDVGVVELAVARRRALGVEQALALDEADLRDGDVGELVLEEGQHLPDRHEGPLGHRRL